MYVKLCMINGLPSRRIDIVKVWQENLIEEETPLNSLNYSFLHGKLDYGTALFDEINSGRQYKVIRSTETAPDQQMLGQ